MKLLWWISKEKTFCHPHPWTTASAQLSWQKGAQLPSKHSLPQWARCRCWLCHLFQVLCSTSQKIVPTALGRKWGSEEVLACFNWWKDIRCFKDTLAAIRDVSFPHLWQSPSREPCPTDPEGRLQQGQSHGFCSQPPSHALQCQLQPTPCSRGALALMSKGSAATGTAFKVGRPLCEKPIE